MVVEETDLAKRGDSVIVIRYEDGISAVFRIGWIPYEILSLISY